MFRCSSQHKLIPEVELVRLEESVSLIEFRLFENLDLIYILHRVVEDTKVDAKLQNIYIDSK